MLFRMRLRRDSLVAVIMLLPTLVLLGIFVYGFIGQTIYASLTDWGQQEAAMALKPVTRFVGLQNYRDLFTGFLNMRFRQDLVNMLSFTGLFVICSLALGLLLATLIESRVRAEAFFRTVFLFPMSLSFIVTGTIWRWLLQPSGGVNALPALVGLPPGQSLWLSSRDQVLRFNWQGLVPFLSLVALVLTGVGIALLLRRRQYRAAGLMAVPTTVLLVWVISGQAARAVLVPFPELHGFNLALIGIVLAATWQMSGYTMALYLAGLRTIPEELREAARVDGANSMQIHWYIELPLLAPVTWSAVIVLAHIALKIFDLVIAMAGPDHAPTSVPALSMFLSTFRGNQVAVGASIAVMLLILVSLLIVPYLVTSFRAKGGH